MMNWIVGNSLKFRFLILALAAVLMYFGYGQMQNMPIMQNLVVIAIGGQTTAGVSGSPMVTVAVPAR